MLARLPLRLRLTLAFAGVMAVVLLGAGVFLRFSLAGDLDQSILDSLRAQAADVTALVDRSGGDPAGGGGSALTAGGATFAQVLDSSGRVVDSTPTLRGAPLLTPGQTAAAARAPLLIRVVEVPGVAERARLYAVPDPSGPGRVVVVGTSLSGRDDAVLDLTLLLTVGGPVALLLASAAGYGLASAALRPVEEMRARAARISGSSPGERLPLGLADDEIRRLAETLNAMLDRVERAVAHERTFVSDASHELRTPLTILKTELELALRHEHSVEELRAAVASAGEETDRLVGLAEDLLVMARADEGAMALRRVAVEPGALLRDVATRHSARAAAAGRPLDVDAAAGEAGTLDADRERLEQALSNLVENALRYGDGPVRLSARRGDGAVELHVTDAGPGMPDAFIGQAFERFARADAARGRGGTGLGLAIVRAIARAHGGEAHVANVPGGGLDAWMTIPAGGP